MNFIDFWHDQTKTGPKEMLLLVTLHDGGTEGTFLSHDPTLTNQINITIDKMSLSLIRTEISADKYRKDN